ncbi:DUF4145 domain-containing protein [Nocardia sp. NPDC005825]|uniref:DUF4145 domain-containing protein n=1 Tax=unclassified Nocardia TaxID=2637762 RepID=UPI0033E2E011
MDWEKRLVRIDVLPRKLRRALDEVEKCMDGGSYIMAIVAARRGLEALCLDQGAAENTLQKRLEHLQAEGTIDGRLFTWATHLRHVGNEGAHDLDFDPDEEEALDSQNLLERVVQYVYIDQARYEEAKRRWEYRQLPPVDISYRVDEHANGCHLVTIFRPEALNDSGLTDPLLRRVRHSRTGGDPWTKPGEGVDIEDDLWKKTRRLVATLVKDHSVSVGNWNKIDEGKRIGICSQSPFHDDDEPPF